MHTSCLSERAAMESQLYKAPCRQGDQTAAAYFPSSRSFLRSLFFWLLDMVPSAEHTMGVNRRCEQRVRS